MCLKEGSVFSNIIKLPPKKLKRQIQRTPEMSLTHYFEQERLKPTVEAFLNSGCDFDEVPVALKKQMRVYVHDNIPHIWLSDGYHFVEAHFTKEAINDFRKNYSNIKFNNLREKMLSISRWRLVAKYEDSRTSLTSYMNVSVHLVIENFRPIIYEKPAVRQMNETKCLFRDSDIQSIIRAKRHETIQHKIMQQHFYYNSLAVPSARDIFESESRTKLRQVTPQIDEDQMMIDVGEDEKDIVELREKERQEIIDSNRALISQISTQISQSQIVRCQVLTQPLSKDELENDREDIKEMKDMFSQPQQNTQKTSANDSQMMISTGQGEADQQSLTPAVLQYFDMKRLLIQERGEDEYYFLYNRKLKQIQDQLEDEVTRYELTLAYEHYSKEHSRLEFQRHIQIRQLQAKEQKKKRGKRVVRYRLGLQASDIKDRILRFMTTFNPISGQDQENILEERIEMTVEPRERAQSQDNYARNDLSEMIETKTVASHFGGIGGYALSQYICPQSVFNDGGDITESEHDEDEMADPLSYEQKKKVRGLIGQVQPTFTLFKKYYEWFQSHDVMTQANFEKMHQAMSRAAKEQLEREAALERERLRQEQLAIEQEQQRLAAEQLRLQQIEAEKQRRIEAKLAKQRLAQEERLRREEEELLRLKAEAEAARIQQEAEMQRIEQERIRVEAERAAALAEQERKMLEKQRQEELERLEKQKAAERLEALRKEEEERLRIEHKRMEEERNRRFLEEKERLKQELIEHNLKNERERLHKEKLQKEREEQERREAEEAAAQRKKNEEEQAAAAERERIRLAAIAAEQERQERRRKQIEQEEIERKHRFEEERRLRIEEERRAREAAMIIEAEKRRKEEQIKAERALKEEQEKLKLALEAQRLLQAAGTSSQKQQSSQRNNSDENSSVSSSEDEMTAAFKHFSNGEEEEDDEEQILQTQENRDDYSASPNQTQNPLMMLQQSPGSFVDLQVPLVALPPQVQEFDQQSMTLAQIIGLQHQNNNSQSDKKSSQDNQYHHDMTESRGHGHKKHSKKRSRSSSSESQQSSEEDSSSRSLSSDEENSDKDSDIDSDEGSSSNSSESSEEMEEAFLQLAKIISKQKKHHKGKKDKKSKHKSKMSSKMLAQMLALVSQKASKKKRSSSSGKKQKKHSSSDKKNSHRKDEKHYSNHKVTSAFSVDPQIHYSVRSPPQQSEKISSPSTQKPNMNYSYRILDTTASSVAMDNLPSSQVKQVSPPPLRISPAAMGERQTSTFDIWHSNQAKSVVQQPTAYNIENVALNGQNGIHLSHLQMQHQPKKVSPPWEHSHNKKQQEDLKIIKEMEELQYLTGLDKLQKRPRHK